MRLFGHRFSIRPLFWVIWILGCASYLFNLLENLLNTDSWILAGVLLGVMVVSMFWHEIGHILFHRMFGARTLDTVFGAYGGRTKSDASLSRFQNVIVYIAGPVFSLILALGVFIFSLIQPMEGFLWQESIKLAILFNVLWGIVNLVPILPLDGGKLMVGFYPGTKKFLTIFGLLLAILTTTFCILSGRWAGAFLFAVIAYVNINLLFGREV